MNRAKSQSRATTGTTGTGATECMEQIKRSLKARRRRKTINELKRSNEIPTSGMSSGYGKIEQAARLLVRVCQRCEQSEDVMTYAKQTCAFITQMSGRDTTRLRFIQLLIHSVQLYSSTRTSDVVFECSTCRGYSDCKFSEDTEVVKEPRLQRFLEQTFGIRADVELPPPPPPPARKRVRDEEELVSESEAVQEEDDEDEEVEEK